MNNLLTASSYFVNYTQKSESFAFGFFICAGELYYQVQHYEKK